MSETEQQSATDIDALPALPRDEEGPVFQEPWQAQAFAMAVDLANQGCFSWKEWAAALGEELRQAAEQGNPDDGSHYYHHWVTALEKLVASKNVTNQSALDETKDAWEAAYRRTPHGKPVLLNE